MCLLGSTGHDLEAAFLAAELPQYTRYEAVYRVKEAIRQISSPDHVLFEEPEVLFVGLCTCEIHERSVVDEVEINSAGTESTSRS